MDDRAIYELTHRLLDDLERQGVTLDPVIITIARSTAEAVAEVDAALRPLDDDEA
jgi:hypothetical protein